MKKIILMFLLSFCIMTVKAMSYEEARDRAWFLTDKMAYELNLTAEQYDRAYQINLDYLMSIHSASECVGVYWQYRDADLRCILFDWQYNLYRTLDYFYRPLRWYEARWYYPVFDHYRYGYYYFDRPTVYVSYRGGMWLRRGHNAPSPYLAMRPQHGLGMRDQYKRGWMGSGVTKRPQSPNGGFRPNVTNRDGGHSSRPNVTFVENRQNNQKDNNQKGQKNAFRDGYTNYRQTGHSQGSFTPINNNKGTNNRGTTRPTMNVGNTNRGTSTFNGQRDSKSNSNVSTSRGGRVFGGR